MCDGEIYSLDYENRSKGIRVFVQENDKDALITDLENEILLQLSATAAQNEGFLKLTIPDRP